jgi:hypothetical protein
VETPPTPVKRRPEPDRGLRQAERFARILRLLGLLQERSPRDAGALSTALDATERTVYRSRSWNSPGVAPTLDPTG